MASGSESKEELESLSVASNRNSLNFEDYFMTNNISFHIICPRLGATLFSLTTVETQAVAVSGKCDFAALGEIEDIAGGGMNRLTSFILDVKFSFHNDLHLIIVVGVDQRCALLESVKSGTDGLLWVVLLTANNVSEIGVLVGDQGRFEFLLRIFEMLECLRAHFCGISVS